MEPAESLETSLLSYQNERYHMHKPQRNKHTPS